MREKHGELVRMMHAYGQSGNDLVKLAGAAEDDCDGGGRCSDAVAAKIKE